MSTADLSLAGSGGPHPALVSRRLRDLLRAGVSGLLALAVALAVAIKVPHPSLPLALVMILGTVGVIALIVSTRYEVTVTLIVLYLGLLDGPVKLLSASRAASAARDVLIFAVVAGMLIRLSSSRQRVRLPPLSNWVLAFTAVVLVEVFNPHTGNILKGLGGYRQLLEWVPFFFFGYLLIRTKDSFRKLFLVFGVIALVNGAVAFYQSRIGPGGLASWGPGYHSVVLGKGPSSGRTFKTEGVTRVRPPALGSDAGFSGGVGILALPGLLALLAAGRLRRRWIVMMLTAGAVLAIATAADRSSVGIALVTLVSYVGLSLVAGLRVSRALVALLAFGALAAGVGYALVAAEGNGVFARQESIANANTGSGETSLKLNNLAQLPRFAAGAPFGSGLGTTAAAAGFGGHQKIEIEGEGASAQGTYEILALEAGTPGLLLWIGLSLNVLYLVLRGLRRIVDVELRTYLVAVFAVYIAYIVGGVLGPTIAVSPEGTYMWFAAGVAAFWFAGPGRSAMRAAPGERPGAATQLTAGAQA